MTRNILNTYDFNEYEKIAREILSEQREEGDEEITDNQILQEALFLMREDEDDIYRELNSFFKDKTVLMVGTCGTWRGNLDGGIVGDFKTVTNALLKDCDYVSIDDEDGRFYIKGSHHDGTNYGEIVVLTDKGIELYEEWENFGVDCTEQELHNKLFNSDEFCSIPRFLGEVA